MGNSTSKSGYLSNGKLQKNEKLQKSKSLDDNLKKSGKFKNSDPLDFVTTGRSPQTQNQFLQVAKLPLHDANGGKQKLDVKVYRSYSSLHESGRQGGSTAVIHPDSLAANLKVFRRSGAVAGPDDAFESEAEQERNSPLRRSTLPRGFGRKAKSLSNSAALASLENLNDFYKPATTLRLLRSSRSATLSRLQSCAAASGTRGVKHSEFPSTSRLKESLDRFRKEFLTSTFNRFHEIAPEQRVHKIPLALFPSADDQGLVTLGDYLHMEEDLDFVGLNNEQKCALYVPAAMFPGLTAALEKRTEAALLIAADDLFKCLAAEVAIELARVYEYQIGMLASDGALTALAEICAGRIFANMAAKKGTVFERNFALFSVTERPRNAAKKTRAVCASVIVGKREIKWPLDDALDKPGLRVDALLTKADCGSRPFQYFARASSDPMTFGYRGETLRLDRVAGLVESRANETDEFDDEVMRRFDDFHRSYSPYHWLFGSRALRAMEAKAALDSGFAAAAKYVGSLVGGGDDRLVRDEIKIVFKRNEGDPTGNSSRGEDDIFDEI